MKVSCKDCGILKEKIKFGEYFKDENGGWWGGRSCYDCCKLKVRIKNNKPIVKKSCAFCTKEFKTNKPKVTCSYSCTNKLSNLKKYKKTEYRNQCSVCLIEFNCNRRNTKYCSDKCKSKESKRRYRKTASYKRFKKAKRRIDKGKLRNAKTNWCSWGDIAKFYDACPKESHVDHIIPLNHPDICGLHTVSNFQYLTAEENSLKSNQWDGTLENETWKNKK